MDTVFGYDDDSMDSETSSVASYRTDRTPATPDDDLDEVRSDSFHRQGQVFKRLQLPKEVARLSKTLRF